MYKNLDKPLDRNCSWGDLQTHHAIPDSMTFFEFGTLWGGEAGDDPDILYQKYLNWCKKANTKLYRALT